MSHLPNGLHHLLESTLEISIKHFSPAAGGCINNGGELITSAGSFFLKWNARARYPAMFQKEAAGLGLLANHSNLRIPKVVKVIELNEIQALVLEFIKSSRPSAQYWRLLGERLAALHRHTSSFFGLDHHNYIGSLQQNNTPCTSWIEFFIKHRLEAQLALVFKNSLADYLLGKQFELLYRKLPDLLPLEPPALVHGDLWSGNVMVDEKGQPCLIDPAVYYGHREAELAFTHLFGGFDEMFYQAYDHAFPLQPGFEERVDIYNLYPLLVHVNLFGSGYLHQVKKIVMRFVR